MTNSPQQLLAFDFRSTQTNRKWRLKVWPDESQQAILFGNLSDEGWTIHGAIKLESGRIRRLPLIGPIFLSVDEFTFLSSAWRTAMGNSDFPAFGITQSVFEAMTKSGSGGFAHSSDQIYVMAITGESEFFCPACGSDDETDPWTFPTSWWQSCDRCHIRWQISEWGRLCYMEGETPEGLQRKADMLMRYVGLNDSDNEETLTQEAWYPSDVA